jgi:hypothetical protein
MAPYVPGVEILETIQGFSGDQDGEGVACLPDCLLCNWSAIRLKRGHSIDKWPAFCASSARFQPCYEGHAKKSLASLSKNPVGRMNYVANKDVQDLIDTGIPSYVEKGEAFDSAFAMNLITLRLSMKLQLNADIGDDAFNENMQFRLKEFFLHQGTSPLRAAFGSFLPTARSLCPWRPCLRQANFVLSQPNQIRGANIFKGFKR